jgi:hypothetical protein
VTFVPLLLKCRPFNTEQYNTLLQVFTVVAANGMTSIKAIQAFHGVINKEIQKEEAASNEFVGGVTGSLLHRKQQKAFGHMFLESSSDGIPTSLCSAVFLKDAIVHLQLICARCAVAVKEAAAANLENRYVNDRSMSVIITPAI